MLSTRPSSGTRTRRNIWAPRLGGVRAGFGGARRSGAAGVWCSGGRAARTPGGRAAAGGAWPRTHGHGPDQQAQADTCRQQGSGRVDRTTGPACTVEDCMHQYGCPSHLASRRAMSCGVETMTAPDRGMRWPSVIWVSPVPGGRVTTGGGVSGAPGRIACWRRDGSLGAGARVVAAAASAHAGGGPAPAPTLSLHRPIAPPPCTRRHVDHQNVQPPPVRAQQEVVQRLGRHRAAPYDGRVVLAPVSGARGPRGLFGGSATRCRRARVAARRRRLPCTLRVRCPFAAANAPR